MAPPHSNVRFRILALLMAYAAMCHFNRIGISAAGSEHIMQEFEVSETQMGLVYTSYLVVYTCCMTPGGWFIDRFGPKLALVLMGLGSAVLVPLTGAASLAPSGTALLALLIVIRGCLGAFNAPMHPGAARSISFWFPMGVRKTANGMVTGAAVAGIAVTYSLFGFMMDRMGWPLAFVVSGAATLILACVWAACSANRPGQHAGVSASERALIEAGDPLLAPFSVAAGSADAAVQSAESSAGQAARGAPGSTHAHLLSLLSDRCMLLLTLSFAMAGYFQYLFFYWVQYYFDKILKLGKDDARLYATIPTVGMAVGMIYGSYLADKIEARLGGWRGRALTPIISMVLSAVLLWLGILGGPPGQVVTCFTLAMLVLGASESSFWVTAIELGRRRGGLSAAILNTGGNAGGLLAPIVTPWFSSFFGWQAGLAVAGVLCVLGAALWWGIEPAREQVAPVVVE
jgi:MFS family permease